MANKIYKLKIEEGILDEYFIAIHSTLEAYQLAYYVNKQNKILLKRKKDFNTEKKKGSFYLFEWKDIYSEFRCQLISNKFIYESNNIEANSNSLFEFPERNEVYLISEFKEADFFIKSTNLEILKNIKIQLNNFSMVMTAYNVYLNNKTRMDLIFD
jgi:hypothetical protein